jgi:hypothetical protein
MVPITHNPITHAFELNRSPGIIAHLITVLSAIGFDNQSGFQTYKIHNIGFYHNLAPELVSRQTTCPQMLPQYAFRIAGLAAQRTGTCKQVF